MHLLHTLSFYTHVTIGSVALVVFWLPVFARKGSPFHKRAGRWFANSMYAVSVTGLVMSTIVLIDPIGIRFGDTRLDMAAGFEQAERIRLFAAFLLMLSVLVFTSVRHAIIVLRARADRSILREPAHLALQGSLAALGLAVGVFGLRSGELLLIIFAAVSLSAAAGMLRYSFKPTLSRNEWWIEHLGSIIGAGIGAYTAFFAFGGRRFLADILTGQWQVVPWVLPAIVGTAFSMRLSRYYRRRFAKTRERAGATSGATT